MLPPHWVSHGAIHIGCSSHGGYSHGAYQGPQRLVTQWFRVPRGARLVTQYQTQGVRAGDHGKVDDESRRGPSPAAGHVQQTLGATGGSPRRFPNTVYNARQNWANPNTRDLRQQAIALGLGEKFEAIEDMYYAADKMLGHLVKVTPSSKVVGDLALQLVAALAMSLTCGVGAQTAAK